MWLGQSLMLLPCFSFLLRGQPDPEGLSGSYTKAPETSPIEHRTMSEAQNLQPATLTIQWGLKRLRSRSSGIFLLPLPNEFAGRGSEE